jgi:hypothetical protein
VILCLPKILPSGPVNASPVVELAPSPYLAVCIHSCLQAAYGCRSLCVRFVVERNLCRLQVSLQNFLRVAFDAARHTCICARLSAVSLILIPLCRILFSYPTLWSWRWCLMLRSLALGVWCRLP